MYSTALYEAAVAENSVEAIWNDVKKLKKLLVENADFTSYMINPLWTEKDKTDVLNDTAKILGLNKDTTNCLQSMIENRRMAELSSVLNDFEDMYYKKSSIAKVKVETVKSLTAMQESKLSKVLESVLKQNVVIDYEINPSILGGLRIQCGSKMFDDCLASKLNYLENTMKGK